MLRKLLPVTGIVGTFVLMLTACAPSTTPRKKLPAYLSAGVFESDYYFKSKITQQDLFSLYTSTESVMLQGRSANFVVLPLPSAEYDAAIIALIQEYKPAALAVLTGWAMQQSRGVVLDLRSATGQFDAEAQYILQKTGAFSIPVILRWNQAAATRARSFISLLDGVPGVTIQKLN